MAGKVTGICIIRMNGKSLRSKEKATLSIGGVERTAQYADNGFAGFSTKPVCAKVTATLIHDASTNLQEIHDAENVSIEFASDTGISYMVPNAFSVKPPELTGGDGDVAVEFEGSPAVQQ